MAREIRIHIAADANLAALREVNTQSARLAMDVGRRNSDLRQATMLAAREYINLGDASEKTAIRVVLSAKQIEEAWRKAMAKPTEDATKGFAKIAQSVSRGIGGALGRISTMFLQGGIWGAMAAAATKAFSLIWDHFEEQAERAAKRAERKFSDTLESIKNGAETVEKTFDGATTAIDRSISRFDALTNSVKELTKAEIELAKQHAIANGMDASTANAAAADLTAQVDYEAEEQRLRNVIALEQKRVDGRDVGVTYFHSIDCERHVCDWGIYIHDISCRGHGVGNEVLRRMLDFASTQLNMASVYLDVHAGNKRAIALYERHGFVRCNEQKGGDFIRYERRML